MFKWLCLTPEKESNPEDPSSSFIHQKKRKEKGKVSSNGELLLGYKELVSHKNNKFEFEYILDQKKKFEYIFLKNSVYI